MCNEISKIKKGDLVVHKANQRKDLTVRSINGNEITCVYFDKKVFKQVTYKTEELMPSEYNTGNELNPKCNNDVQLKSSGPIMTIIKIDSDEITCVWNDGNKNCKENFYVYELEPYECIYDMFACLNNH